MRENLREFLEVVGVFEELGLRINGYEIIEVKDGETFEVGEGEEVWIEDRELFGYYHYYKIIYPKDVKLEDIVDILDIEEEGGDFVKWNRFYTLKPKKDRDFIIVYERGYRDEESNEGMIIDGEYRRQMFIYKSKGGV